MDNPIVGVDIEIGVAGSIVAAVGVDIGIGVVDVDIEIAVGTEMGVVAVMDIGIAVGIEIGVVGVDIEIAVGIEIGVVDIAAVDTRTADIAAGTAAAVVVGIAAERNSSQTDQPPLALRHSWEHTNPDSALHDSASRCLA